MRLKFLKSAAISGMVMFAATAASGSELTIVSWGGAYTASQVGAFHKPWASATGNKIISEDYSGGLAEIKSQVGAGSVVWDVVDVETAEATIACDEGLLEEIPGSILKAAPDGTSAQDDYLEGGIKECAAASIVWSMAIGYDSTKYPSDPPSTVADFFDVEKYPGKRGMKKQPKVTLEQALVADGVPASEVYDVLSTEEGVDRAFAKLESMGDNIVWYEAEAHGIQLLANGEVVMSVAPNGRFFNAAVAEGKPIETIWDGQVMDFTFWVIPKGSKNKDLALDFISFATQTDRMAAQAGLISYGPARRSAAAQVGLFTDGKTEMQPHMPTANMGNAVVSSFEFWADNLDELTQRFNAWLTN